MLSRCHNESVILVAESPFSHMKWTAEIIDS